MKAEEERAAEVKAAECMAATATVEAEKAVEEKVAGLTEVATLAAKMAVASAVATTAVLQAVETMGVAANVAHTYRKQARQSSQTRIGAQNTWRHSWTRSHWTICR